MRGRGDYCFGDGLRVIRQLKDVSQEALAERVGILRQTIVKYETGVTCWPKPETREALAAALGVTVADILAAAGYEVAGGQRDRRAAVLVEADARVRLTGLVDRLTARELAALIWFVEEIIAMRTPAPQVLGAKEEGE